MNWDEISDNFKTTIKKQYVVLQEKNKLKGWREVKLGEVAEITMGQSPKSETYNKNGKGLPFYQGIVDFGDRFTTPRVYCSNPKKVIEAGDILLSVRAPVGQVNFTKQKCSIGRGNAGLIMKNGMQNFLFYLLQFSENQFHSNSSGSVFSSINKSNIEDLKVSLPPLPEQKAIAEVLSSLDDKIDLLHRQNKTLENMAQTLFRQWFVEQADAEWEERPLKEVIAIAIGRTPPRKESQWFSTNTEDIKWISIKDMASDGVYTFNTSECLTQKAIDKFNIPVIPNNTVILSFKMTLGRVKITTDKMLSNEAIAHFKFGSETPFSEEYLYLYLKNYRFESLDSTSSIVTAINSTMIKEMLIIVPNQNTMDKFKQISKPLFEKIFSNQAQINTLENLRDILLPKLMSGEVSVTVGSAALALSAPIISRQD